MRIGDGLRDEPMRVGATVQLYHSLASKLNCHPERAKDLCSSAQAPRQKLRTFNHSGARRDAMFASSRGLPGLRAFAKVVPPACGQSFQIHRSLQQLRVARSSVIQMIDIVDRNPVRITMSNLDRRARLHLALFDHGEEKPLVLLAMKRLIMSSRPKRIVIL